jgi:hypothetical protein
MHAVTIEGEYEKHSLTGQARRAGSETETVLVDCGALGLEGEEREKGGKGGVRDGTISPRRDVFG